MKLIDYSYARPDPAHIKQQGFSGVLRYLSPNPGKTIEAAELHALRAAGLWVGLVWEWYASRAKEGTAAGKADGRNALNQANALGFPQYLPIFFAVDFDATPADQGPINAYFMGVRESLAGHKVGAYGGLWPVKRLFDAQLIQYGWQTYAWSGGQWESRAHLRQTLNGQWGGQVDFNEAINSDWGGWGPDVKTGPVLEPKPVRAPAYGTANHVIAAGDTFWGLEAQNGWTHGLLQALNPTLNASALKIGEIIKVPGAAKSAAPISHAAAAGYHTIAAGDTFWGLEVANGWPHGTLQGLNPHVNASKLAVGQKIVVPGGVTPSPAHPETKKHVVVAGDTFWGLETAHKWGHGTLQGLNPKVDPAKLQIGASINIPA